MDKVQYDGTGLAYIHDKGVLACFGCAHSAASEQYPGRPSGERPCMFCVRNPEVESWNNEFEAKYGYRYDTQWNDKTPLQTATPFDAYIATDRLMEERNLRRVSAERGVPVEPTIEDTMSQMHEGLATAKTRKWYQLFGKG